MKNKKKKEKFSQKLISLIIPVYNEEENIIRFYSEFLKYLKNSKFKKKYEIIFVDDGSDDLSLEIIKKITEKDKNVKMISFTKNQGVNTTFSAGLDFSLGDCMIFLDVDGQYPISILDDFYNKWNGGNKIVFAKRKNYTNNFFYKYLTILFVKFINSFSKIKLDHESSYVCLIDREIINILKNMTEITRYYPGLIRWTGFEVGFIECDTNNRKIGKSKIGLRKKVSEAISAITDFTAAPLRIWTLIGFSISIISMIYGFYVLSYAFLNGVDVPGYLSLFLGIVFMGGLQLISLGFLSEYITKIYIEGKKRPQYLIKEKKGL